MTTCHAQLPILQPSRDGVEFCSSPGIVRDIEGALLEEVTFTLEG